jgi:hypothetical protein
MQFGSCRYYYTIGHVLHNGKVIRGKLNFFTAPPCPGQKSLQRIVIFGDMGKVNIRYHYHYRTKHYIKQILHTIIWQCAINGLCLPNAQVQYNSESKRCSHLIIGREGWQQRVSELSACITQHHGRADQGP